MIDGNQLREEFGRYLAEHKATRWGMDAALMHVCKIAYDAGKADGPSAALHSREYEIGVPAEPERRVGPASDADTAVYQSIADGYTRDTAPAPAEVPMPEPDWVTFSRNAEGVGVRVDSLRMEGVARYGAACRAAGEAAGHARGRAEAGRDAERYRWLRDKRRTGELDTHGIYIGVDSPRFVGKWALSGEEADSEIDAALRGEVTCKHGVRSPHECKACADEPTDAEITEWLLHKEVK